MKHWLPSLINGYLLLVFLAYALGCYPDRLTLSSAAIALLSLWIPAVLANLYQLKAESYVEQVLNRFRVCDKAALSVFSFALISLLFLIGCIVMCVFVGPLEKRLMLVIMSMCAAFIYLYISRTVRFFIDSFGKADE